MAVSNLHILQQGPVLRALAEGAIAMIKQRQGGLGGAMVTPGPEQRVVVPPRPERLVKDYIRHVGGDPSSYRGVVPPHLWPQWGFPLAARTLEGIPYPLAKVLNGGCRLEVHGDLPASEPLLVTARLEDIDDNGSRAVLHQRVATGTQSAPELVVAHMYAIVPLSSGKNGATNGASAKPKDKEKPRVPSTAREVGFFRLRRDAGLDFAKLTGDFNPVHWVAPYARAFGFRSVILHGFATMARAIEGLNRSVYAGDARALGTIDVKFTRPLTLPASVGLYIDRATATGGDVFVGDAPGGPAYLVGTYERASKEIR